MFCLISDPFDNLSHIKESVESALLTDMLCA